MKNLREGDSGREIELLQTGLNQLGFNLLVDGIFGQNTKNAVIAFQQNNGLDADGVVGVSTRIHLCRSGASNICPINMQLDISNNGISMLVKLEGKAGDLPNMCEATRTINCKITTDSYGMYQDSEGHCTYGIGHLVHHGNCSQQDIDDYHQKFGSGGMIETDAFNQCREDLTKFIDTVKARIDIEINQCQFDALMIFAFNIGNGAFSESTLVRNINQHILDEDSIKDAFLLFSNPPVLRARRLKEADLFNHCIYI
jgi:GH24 family phage-related lysozyme (muramidase)